MKNISKLILLTGVATVTASAPAMAKDLGQGYLAKERFQIRARLIDVAADGEGSVTQNGFGTDVGHAITPEVDFTYFFDDHISAELILATSNHEIDASNLNLGEAWIVPPTLTLQYHFSPDEQFSPYVGAGLNYSFFWGETSGKGFNNLEVDGGFGYALQAGFDYWLDENWGVNFDVKYVDLDVDVDVNLGATALDARDVELDPVIVGAGISYRF